MIGMILKWMVGVWIFLGSSSGNPSLALAQTEPEIQAHCARCQELESLLLEQSRLNEDAQSKLKSDRGILEKTPKEQIAVRMKLSSTIFVLMSRTETLQNRKLVEEKEMQKLRCSAQCPKSPQN